MATLRTSRARCLPLISAALLAGVFLGTPASAGGDWESVRVLKLSRANAISFTLIVAPIPTGTYLSRCSRFEIHGTLRRLEGEWPIGRSNAPSKKEHIAALEYLQSFERRGRPVNFGWIGEGFRALDPKRPCVVESRGLRVVDGAVVSYFHQT